MTIAGVIAVSMRPAKIGIPYQVNYLPSGTYAHAFVTHPNDDSIETEFLMRMFVIGVIPTILYRQAFLFWPLVSWGALGLIFVFTVQDIKGVIRAFGFCLPFILVTYSGSAFSFVCQYAYERIRARHNNRLERPSKSTVN
jgi:hypothetical protein